MTEQKEFESLDELFRKTFDNLPETPAKSGWDTPSERVWQHVQEQIKPPQSGWSPQTLTLIAAFVVTLTVGLYLFLNRPTQPETPAAVPPPVVAEMAEQPASNTGTQEQLNVTPVVAPESSGSVVPAKTSKKKSSGAEQPLPENNTESEAAEVNQTDSSKEKPAEQKRKVPNTTLRLKAELAKRAEEAWGKPLDPLPQRWPGKSKD